MENSPAPLAQEWVYHGQAHFPELKEEQDTGHTHISVDVRGQFWFWDESSMDVFGPFVTIDECKASLASYGETI